MREPMTVRELLDWLGQFDETRKVEIGTSDDNSKWYNAVEVEEEIGSSGELVVVIHTD